MDDNSLLSAALRYASHGIAVFPVHLAVRGGDKKAVYPIDEWKSASSTDPDTIRSWWGPGSRWEHAAIGGDCGKSGIVGVDQDVADGKDGLANWEALSPAPTWRVRSPTGGAHDYYRADPDHPVTVDNTGTVADGVDIRGNGGFLFMPPSIDPRGGSWEWVAGEPEWESLPTVPRVVTERMENKKTGKAKKAPVPAPAVEFEAPPVQDFNEGGSLLFGWSAQQGEWDFGPGGGYKTESAARALLGREHQEFLALTTEGSARSHRLSQRFGVMAGYGVDVFWTYDWALDVLMQACRENGFADANGEGYARGQAERGLEHGMRTPWIRQPEPAEAFTEAAAAAPVDDVDALLREMLTPGEITARPAPRQLIHGLLQVNSESWVIGPPGSKKSFVVLDMAAAVIRGAEWQGRRTIPADVVMIVAEGAGGVGKRIKAWEARNGKMPEGLFILPRPVQAGIAEKWGVLVRACKRLAGAAEQRGREFMVILDTQARVTVGLKENDATDMGIFIGAVSAIRDATKGCVLTVHHTGRAGGDARGSSAIDGAQTTELKVMPGKNKLSATLSVEKQKDIEEIEPIRLGFEVVEVGQDEDGQTVTSLVLAGQDSVAFRLAWEGALTEQPASEAKLKDRKALDPWIEARRPERGQQPTIAWWIVQALVDTAETLGLTQSDVKGIVEEKRGQIDKTTFKRAWQKVTEDDGEWSDVVVKAGGERWTVDRVVIAGFVKEFEGSES